jgi:hypothetical protein
MKRLKVTTRKQTSPDDLQSVPRRPDAEPLSRFP